MAFNLTVFSPSAAQCETASLLWAGGRAPYSVSVLDARNPINMPTLDSAGSSLNSRLQYLVKIPAGTLVKFRVIDSGSPPQVADSTLVNIRDSGDDSCLPDSQQTNGGSTPTPSSTRPVPSSDSDEETSTESTEPQESTPSADASTTRTSSPTGLSGTRSSSRTSSQSPRSSTTNTDIENAAGSDGSNAPESSGISGALVGGIVAGVIVVIFAIVGLLLWRKRRQRRAAQDDEDWFATQPSATVGRANTAVTRYTDDKDGPIVMSAVTPSSRANSLRGLMERDPSYRATTDASTEDVHSVYAQNMNIPQVIVTRDSFVGDVKRPLNILSAEDYGSSSSRPTRSAAQPPSAAVGLPSGSSSSEDVQVPPQLSEAEMTRLADLVASRMRTADPEESPPVYHH